MATAVDWDSLPAGHPFPGVENRQLDAGELTLLYYRMAPYAAFPLHRHPEAQTVVVVKGWVRCRQGAEPGFVLRAGGTWSAGPWEPHGMIAGPEGAEFINCIAPRRVQNRTELLESLEEARRWADGKAP